MSLVQNKLEKTIHVDTAYLARASKGEVKITDVRIEYREENNNEIDEISRELSEMGCIVNAAKRPPNICVENCVHEESASDNEDKSPKGGLEDTYSDEFEEDHSGDEETASTELKVSKNELNNITQRKKEDNVKISTSQASVSSKQTVGSISGRSSTFGSVSMARTRRANMSFTNDRLREIERHNHILLKKILNARNTKSSIPSRQQDVKRINIQPSAAANRRRAQRQIDHDNLILLKKIQTAKSSSYSLRR